MTTESYSFVWHIFLGQIRQKSKVFPKTTSVCKWDILMKKSRHIFLRSIAAPHGKIKCNYTAKVINKDLYSNEKFENIVENVFEFVNESEATSHTSNILFSHTLIENIDDYICEYLAENVTINIDITVRISSEQDPTTNFTILNKQNYKERSNNPLLNSILKDTEFYDMTIEVNDIEFKVHKIVLSAASPVFKAILASNMSEKKSNCIKIKDLKTDAIQLMIDFIYERPIEIPDRHIAADLLTVSSTYDIPKLTKLSSKYLTTQINQDSVLEILITAEMCNIPDLTKTAMDFLISHPKPYQPEDFELILKISPKMLLIILANVFNAYTECKY